MIFDLCQKLDLISMYSRYLNVHLISLLASIAFWQQWTQKQRFYKTTGRGRKVAKAVWSVDRQVTKMSVQFEESLRYRSSDRTLLYFTITASINNLINIIGSV